MTTPVEERQAWDAKAEDAAYQVWNERNEIKWRVDADNCADYFHQELSPVWGVDSVFIDIGCGIGRLTHRLSDRDNAPFIHGIDISKPMLDIAAKNKRKNEKFSLCDGRSLELPDATVDGVYSMITFQHIPPEAFEGYIGEISRVLKAGGMFCFQYVEGENKRRLAYESKLANVLSWCNAYGLTVSKLKSSFIFDNWMWLTGGKCG